jgi:uncharacterized protein YheU (UPF0270 family)
MQIPHRLLSPFALRAIVAEFVTRDGTDHSAVDERIEFVLTQLELGHAALYFDEETQTPNIVPTNQA